jgi:enoyl-[acyl-carrier protein] reductase I
MVLPMGRLEGRRGLIVGVANERSLAWAIAQVAHREGATLAITYAGDAFERRVRPLAESIGAPVIAPCDVTDPAQIEALFRLIDRDLSGLDFVVHGVAFAPREELSGRFVDTARNGFTIALDVSAYSFIALARAAAPRMPAGGSVLTLTFQGAQRVFPNYNVMGVAKAALESSVRYLAADLGPQGIRVNAISAGPVKTLSAAGISRFREMLGHYAERAPLRRNITAAEVGEAAAFLVSPAASGITATILHVDAGYHAVGV